MADSGTEYLHVITVTVSLYILTNSGFSTFNAASHAAVVTVAEQRAHRANFPSKSSK
jgi:hypothetical protein